MAATRKAAKEAEMRRISQIGDFKKRLGGIQELPSGFTVKVRNPGGLQAFMNAGTIPNGLMTHIQKAIDKGKGISAQDIIPDGKIDAQMLTDITNLMDEVALATVVAPKLHRKPTADDLAVWNSQNPDNQLDDPEDLRSDEKLYIDELPTDDKQFLLQWVTGGTRDLEEFRQKLDSRMVDVSAVARAGSISLINDGVDEG